VLGGGSDWDRATRSEGDVLWATHRSLARRFRRRRGAPRLGTNGERGALLTTAASAGWRRLPPKRLVLAESEPPAGGDSAVGGGLTARKSSLLDPLDRGAEGPE